VTTIVSFIVVIGILIVIHELGHFVVARLAGVGVERFSIGFGPVLLRWRGEETEYCLSVIPMGGYVKMVGEENPLEGGGSPTADPAKAFATKPLWARFLIVFAGPGMNFVLAAAIFAGVFATMGRPVWSAVVGKVSAGGAAAAAGLRSGDRIARVNGIPVGTWEDLERAVASSDGKPLSLTVMRGGAEEAISVVPRRLAVTDPVFKESKDVWDIGAGPKLLPQISAVTPASPAEAAGLRAGDVVLAIDGEPAFAVEDVQRAIEKRPGRTFPLVVERDGQRVTLSVTARRDLAKTASGEEVPVGRIGVVISTRIERTEPYGPLESIGQGVVRTWELTVLTVKGLWKILSRQIDSSNIGGPIQIASEAGRQAKEGLGSLALFTAIISVNLAVLNLLPVPMLDGGHLLFFLIEAVLGRPLSLRKREAAQQLGFVLLILLMVYALYNDLVRIDAFKFLRQ
jgi:regulator of sigma E protease